MGLIVAIKSFWKALRDKNSAKKFLEPPKEAALLEEKAIDTSHLQLLSQLQAQGRLLDFLKEDISPFSDAQVGAAVRKIHTDCAGILEEVVTIRPVMEDAEGATVSIPPSYNASEIKLVGNVDAKPPLKGILRHRGWRAHKLSTPKRVGDFSREVLAPAEIEVQ